MNNEQRRENIFMYIKGYIFGGVPSRDVAQYQCY